MNSLGELTVFAQVNVLNFLNYRGLAVMRRVNKQFHALLCASSFWRERGIFELGKRGVLSREDYLEMRCQLDLERCYSQFRKTTASEENKSLSYPMNQRMVDVFPPLFKEAMRNKDETLALRYITRSCKVKIRVTDVNPESFECFRNYFLNMTGYVAGRLALLEIARFLRGNNYLRAFERYIRGAVFSGDIPSILTFSIDDYAMEMAAEQFAIKNDQSLVFSFLDRLKTEKGVSLKSCLRAILGSAASRNQQQIVKEVLTRYPEADPKDAFDTAWNSLIIQLIDLGYEGYQHRLEEKRFFFPSDYQAIISRVGRPLDLPEEGRIQETGWNLVD